MTKNYPTPQFIEHPVDSYSIEHQMACMAWNLCVNKTPADIEMFFRKQMPKVKEAHAPYIAKCTAWIWLIDLSVGQVRNELAHLKRLKPAHAKLVQDALNQLRDEARAAVQPEKTA